MEFTQNTSLCLYDLQAVWDLRFYFIHCSKFKINAPRQFVENFRMVYLVRFLLVCFGAVYGAQAIISGIPSAIDDHPYQVAISSNGKFIGGGVIISPNVVLSDKSAYNQVLLQYSWPLDSVNLTIRAGSSNNNQGGDLVDVKRVVVITEPQDEYSDLYLSILVLKKNLTFSETVQSIEMARDLPQMPMNCSISGWGYTTTTFLNLPVQLQGGLVTLVSNSNCNITAEDEQFTNTLCVSGADACTGDAGGPLACNGQLVGLASYLQHCGQTNFTGSYNNIPMLYDKIFEMINQREIYD